MLVYAGSTVANKHMAKDFSILDLGKERQAIKSKEVKA